MMRGNTVKFVLCLLVVALAGQGATPAAGRTGKKKPTVSRPDADKAYVLEDIMKSPKEYQERQVFFYCRFASTANLFKSVNTRFSATEHTNFAVWPDKTVLWEPEGRKNVLPTLYVSKLDDASLEVLRTVKKYELLAVTGYVLNVYARYPWILVTKLEKVQTEQDTMCDQVIEHMQAGYDALSKNFGGVAARHFEQAIQFGLPAEYMASAYKQLACAYHIDNQLDKAQDYLRLAVECNPADPLLHLALADVCLRMGDGEEALAHCVFAMERSGRYPQTYGIMGEAKSLSGDYVKAFVDLNAAANTPGITPRESAMVKVRRARIYNRAARYTDAAQVYAAVSEPGEPLGGEPWLLNEVGLFYESLYLKSGDARYLDSASDAYAEAARLSRYTDVSILYNQAETEFRRQRLSGAPEYAKVQELINDINKVEAEYPPARILEGRVLNAQGRAEEADQRYQTVVRLISDDALALMALSEAYSDLGRYSDAADAMKRARTLQPWNHRIKAMGEFLEGTAPRTAQAEPMQYGQYGAARTPSVEGYEYVKESYLVPLPATPGQTYAPPATYYAPQTQYAPIQGGGTYEQGSPQSIEESYRVDGRLITVRPGESIRVSSRGFATTEAAPMYPQEIQASAQPAPIAGRPERSYPVTHVDLGDAYPMPSSAPSQSARDGGALNLGYVPAPPAAPMEAPAPVWVENPAAGFEFEPLPEPIEIGMGVASNSAFASLPPPRMEGDRETINGRLPPFNFEPDPSPAIISGFQAPEELALALPVRNANLFRRAGGVRQPAEIIEKDQVAPRAPHDASAMTSAADGAVRRTEVSLPSSAVGIGMASDYNSN